MHFIVDNYFWFLIVGGVLLMITMGYYADKTKFGKRKWNDGSEEIENLDIMTATPVTSVNLNAAQSPVNNGLSDILYNNQNIVPQKDEVAENLELTDLPVAVNASPSAVPTQKNIDDSLEQVDLDDDKSNPINVNQTDDDIWKF